MTWFCHHVARCGMILVALLVMTLDTSCRAPERSVVSGAPSVVAGSAVPSVTAIATSLPAAPSVEPTSTGFRVREFPVPAGSHPHDVAVASDGTIWYTAQAAGELGRLDSSTGQIRSVKLGTGSAPHGVILGTDGAAWVTDGGLNAIVRVDQGLAEVQKFQLPPAAAGANLNTAVFDRQGILWFTGQSGFIGRLDPSDGAIRVSKAPRGVGPYGITVTPAGDVFFASLAGSYLGRIDLQTGAAEVLEPPTPQQGARRVWSDSKGNLWISEWNAGQVGVFDPKLKEWHEFKLPGDRPMPYAVYVDEKDAVWLSDFGANALVRFDPAHNAFETFPLPSPGANIRQLAGRPGEVWGAESGADKLLVVRAP